MQLKFDVLTPKHLPFFFFFLKLADFLFRKRFSYRNLDWGWSVHSFLRSLEIGHSKGEYRGTCFILSHTRCPLVRKSPWSSAQAQPTVPESAQVTERHSNESAFLYINLLLCNRKGKENTVGSEVSQRFAYHSQGH